MISPPKPKGVQVYGVAKAQTDRWDDGKDAQTRPDKDKTDMTRGAHDATHNSHTSVPIQGRSESPRTGQE